MATQRPRDLAQATAPRQVRVGVLALALLMTGIVLPSPGAEASSLEGPAWFTLEKGAYGPNEYVYLETGQIGFYPVCIGGGKSDFWYPVADIYVVAGADTTDGAALTDVSGTPNTVIGTFGGGIFFELIATTAPGGKLGSGVYSVVIDECQNKKFDAGTDTILRRAFTVTIPVDAPPPPPGFNAFKGEAQEMGDLWKRKAEADKRMIQMLSLLETIQNGISPRALLTKIIVDEIQGYALSQASEALGVPLATSIQSYLSGGAVALELALADHYHGIAADPPDPSYDELAAASTALDDRLIVTGPTLEASMAAVADEAAIEAGLAEAYLHAVEKYQGADADDAGLFALAQARSVQGYAELLEAQASASRAAVQATRDALASDPRDVDTGSAAMVDAQASLVAQPLSEDERAVLLSLGVSQALVDVAVNDVRAANYTLTRSALLTDMDDLLATYDAAAANLATQATEWSAIADTLAADPNVDDVLPIADAGGPYTANEGEPVPLDASASTSASAITSYAWDLDGDGVFDDATGATPAWTAGQAVPRLVGLHVTNAAGFESIDYAPVTLADTDGPAQLTPVSPATERVDVLVGDTVLFEVSASDPEGEPVTVSWMRNTTTVQATGTTWSWTPTMADVGGHFVHAVADDGSPTGGSTTATWNVVVRSEDKDGDSWGELLDCDDNDPSIHPGAADVLNGVDDDCDPSTPDGGTPPVLATKGGRDYAEGDLVRLTTDPGSTPETANEVTWSHPDGTSATYTATVDWGDGTVEAATYDATFIWGDHRYADEGLYTATVCMAHELGARNCTRFDVNVANAEPILNILDLHAWTARPEGGQHDWDVAPDGQSTVQLINGNPTLFVSNFPFGHGEAEVKIKVLTTGDDDFIGFAIGYEPGMDDDPDAEWWLVDWKQGDQHFDGFAPEGLALSRVRGGVASADGFWDHTGDVTEVQRGFTLDGTGWNDQQEYTFRFSVTPTRLQVWVNDVLELDHNATYGPSYLSFYNYSQSAVQYRGLTFDSMGTQEGAATEIRGIIGDPGTADTHTALANFGDGSPDEAVRIEPFGDRFKAATSHTYLEDGLYDFTICAEDNDGARNCTVVPMNVANVPPVVDAGPDVRSSGQLELASAAFTDAGILDTHTATVDWGDSSAVAPAAVDEYLGAGTVAASHDYTTDGLFSVTVCVTDDEGDTGCDGFEVNVTAPAPPVAVTDDFTGIEGQPYTHPVAWDDPNWDDTFTVTVDWGDGSAPETVDAGNVTFRKGLGVAFPTHTYGDDGTYTVTLTVCDQTDRCDTATGLANIANLPPVAGDDAIILDEDTSLTFDPRGNDTDVAADLPLTISAVTQPLHGTTSTDGATLTYVPVADYDGPDAFTYTVDDGDGGQATATVLVTVLPVNDPPVALPDVHVLTEDDASATVDALGNDFDVDDEPIHIERIVTAPGFGSATTDGATITYAPLPDYCNSGASPDQLVYEIMDTNGTTAHATVYLHVTCVNDAPVVRDDHFTAVRYASISGNVLFNDEDVEDGRPTVVDVAQHPANGTVELAADGSFTYTPDPSRFRGDDKFVYLACDADDACDHATAFIVEDRCGADGLLILEGTLLVGTVSGVVYEEVEPRVAQHVGPEAAAVVHEVNCKVVVPAEDAADGVIGGPPGGDAE